MKKNRIHNLSIVLLAGMCCAAMHAATFSPADVQRLTRCVEQAMRSFFSQEEIRTTSRLVIQPNIDPNGNTSLLVKRVAALRTLNGQAAQRLFSTASNKLVHALLKMCQKNGSLPIKLEMSSSVIFGDAFWLTPKFPSPNASNSGETISLFNGILSDELAYDSVEENDGN
ncbi:MAG: hypothetical protein M1549_01415 [Candidatus Dependentiae bacterium]|nr:hypothetical protein [Candidatus Dependentiae bacterium]